MPKKKKFPLRKLSRTEVVTVRFNPKLKFGLELAAREQQRTSSSFIEWAVREALKQSHETILELVDEVWDPDPADRLLKLSNRDPRLLNFEETIIIKIIDENKDFFYQGRSSKLKRTGLINVPRIRRCWEQLKDAAAGNLDVNDITDPEGGESIEP